tara:strand:+ start:244 stop:477 length:234 start_codon:yes stop_codon:yes gene_type:complete
MKIETVKDKLYTYGVLYLGTLIMMTSPFFINLHIGKIGMLVGLSLLTVQTQKTKQYNLSLLNVVAIVGYLYSLYQTI